MRRVFREFSAQPSRWHESQVVSQPGTFTFSQLRKRETIEKSLSGNYGA
jgi:hypothetical protein